MRQRGRCAALAACSLLAALALAASANAAFPGKNGRIAFAHNGGTSWDVWSVNADGSDPVNMTNTPDLHEMNPAWSPDGQFIAFTRLLASGAADGIHYMRADGSELRQVGSLFGGGTIDWSPAGDRLVVAPQGGLVTITLDGDVQTVKGAGPSQSLHPAWSPNGDRMAFSLLDFGAYRDIHTIRPDGTDERVVTNTDHVDEHPDWSPDGEHIGFSRDQRLLYYVRPDGTGLTFVSDSDPRRFAWSPDGSKLATEHYPAGAQTGADISVIDLDGTNRRTFSLPGQEEQPDWQPRPNRPPDCTGVRAFPDEIRYPAPWRFVRVKLRGATDPDGDAVSIRIDGVTQDEPVRGRRDHTSPDARPGATPDRVRLRAERNPKGDGRVYRISFTVSDAEGDSCTGTATVGVPRHKHRPAVDSAPPSYDSFSS